MQRFLTQRNLRTCCLMQRNLRTLLKDLNITKLVSLRACASQIIGLIFTTPTSFPVTTNCGSWQFLNLCWFNNTNQSLMQTSHQCLCIFNMQHSFVHPLWCHTPSARIPLSHVTSNAPCHYIITINNLYIFHFFTVLFFRLTTWSCSRITAVPLQMYWLW